MSKGHKHTPAPPQQQQPQQQKFPWEGRPHRLRTILVSGVVEVTNAAGELEDVWTSEAFPIHEAKITDGIKAIVAERLHLASD